MIQQQIDAVLAEASARDPEQALAYLLGIAVGVDVAGDATPEHRSLLRERVERQITEITEQRVVEGDQHAFFAVAVAVAVAAAIVIASIGVLAS